MRHLIVLDEVTSTNDVCVEHARAGVASGFAVAARYQSKGRGRRGARWESLDAENLYVSVLHRTRLPLSAVAGLTLDIGSAVAASLRGHYGLAVSVKWPNDLLVGAAKLGGILCELHSHNRESFIVVGLGLNVNAQLLPDSLKYPVTSLQAQLGRTLVLEEVRAQVVLAIRQASEAYEQRGKPNVEAFLAHTHEVGQQVQDEQGRIGTITGIASDGALMLLWERAHAPEPFIAGELTRVAPL